MGVQDRLDALTTLVEEARAMPMSASCIVNRAEVLELLDEIRAALPEALADAERVLLNRRAVIDEGRAEAERIIDDAYAERNVLVSESEIVRQAEIEAERIVGESHAEAESMRQEVDDYVDARLAHFEVLLEKTLATVERGRARLAGADDRPGMPGPAAAADGATGVEVNGAGAADAAGADEERQHEIDRADGPATAGRLD